MASEYYRVQQTHLAANGIGADNTQNTMHFWWPAGSAAPPALADFEALCEALEDFWDAAHAPGAGPIAGYIADDMLTSTEVKIYDLEDPIPRVPQHVETITRGVPTGTGAVLPSELAVCLSFQSNPIAGQVQARRRGRIYVGPLTIDAIEGVGFNDTVAPSPARVAPELINRLTGGADFLANELIPLGWIWCVYSPTTDSTAPIGDAFHTIVGGWVDNAFDIQRRRGVAPTLRTNWSV